MTRYLFCALLTLSLAEGAQGIDGRWAGNIDVLGQRLEITVVFEAAATRGTIDIPVQGAMGISLQNVSYRPPVVHFEIPGIAVAVLEGQLDGDTIVGSFTQSGIAGSFELARAGQAVEYAEKADLPPYLEREVEFFNGNVRLAGTLTLPTAGGPFPAVILITGSGPQNRDQELFGFRPFRLMADHLTRHGVAVLRYDDRGVGGSTGSVPESTSLDFAGDVVAAASLLAERDDIDARRIGAIGHSEGGVVAPMAAASGQLGFIILLAGSALPGEDILYAQGQLIMQANGATLQQMEKQKSIQQMMFQATRSNAGWEAVSEGVAAQIRRSLDDLPEEQRQAIVDVEAYVNQQVQSQLFQVQTPWFRAFLDYDPRPALEALNIPVLALFGELDLQVPAESNARAMRQAFEASGHENFRIEILTGANHLFQTAQTGSPSEYPDLDKSFVPELLPMLTRWILSQ